MKELTQEIYIASRPPEVQALLRMGPDQARMDEADRLAKAGFSIDANIDAIGWDADKMMATRLMYGVLWVPKYGDNLPPPEAMRVLPAAKGAILTSFNAEDPQYQPFAVPKPPTPAPSSHVGDLIGNGVYQAIDVYLQDGSLRFKEGDPDTHNGVAVRFHVGRSAPFGFKIGMWLDDTAWARLQSGGTV